MLGEVNAELKMVFGKPELTAAKDGGGGNNVDVTGKLEAGTGVVGIKGIGMIPAEKTLGIRDILETFWRHLEALGFEGFMVSGL